MQYRIQLLATDFDGTVFRHGNQSIHYPAMRDRLERLRAHGGVWLVCSGRSARNLHRATTSMVRSGVTPDFGVVRHRTFIARRGTFWYPHLPLTLRLRAACLNHRMRAASAIDGITRRLRLHFPRCRVIPISARNVKVQFRDEGDIGKAAPMVNDSLSGVSGVTVTFIGREIDVHVAPYAKGMAVRCLARHLNIPPAGVLSIGDGRNDLYMFSPDVSRLTGCPAGSHAEVVQAVVETGGHVAAEPGIAGVLETIDAHLDDRVRSALPDGWRPPVTDLDPALPASRMDRSRQRSTEVALIVGSLVVGVLVLVAFNVIPYGSRIARLLQNGLTRILGH